MDILIQENGDSYKHVLYSGDPDSGYEYFWYLFKDSVHNFVTSIKILDRESSAGSYARIKACADKVQSITERLNKYKKAQQYHLIRDEIESFLIEFFNSTLFYAEDQYSIAIAHTNMKRWRRCATLQGHNPDQNMEFDFLSFMYSIVDNCDEGTEEFIRQSYMTTGLPKKKDLVAGLCSLATQGREGLCSKLATKYPEELYNYVQKHFGIKLPPGIKSGRKILKCLKK